MQLLFRHKLLLGATPCSANGAGSSSGFWPQASSPSPGLGAYVRNINKCKRNLTSFGQNQGLAWSSDSSLWGNQVQKRILTSFGQNQGLAWSADSSLWGNQVHKKIISFGQNQGLAWSSDSSLWGNQVHKKNHKFWTEPRPCMVHGLKPMGKPST